ncbi:MAG: hypothetical protein M3092_00945 [Actinomycetia bacterium]|nr:hypothetical protein [Actinomycetes bacterium]
MGEIPLSEFVEAAGSALATAQKDLVGTEMPVTSMAVSEAEIDLAIAVNSTAEGGVGIQSISLADLSGGALDAAGLSRLKLNYVAVVEDHDSAVGIQPRRPKSDVVAEVSSDESLIRLGAILGGLEIDASYVPATQKWLVVAKDPSDNVVREIVIDDLGR